MICFYKICWGNIMLFIFVEGQTDETFLSTFYGVSTDAVRYIQYSGLKNDKVNSFISSISKMPDCDYMFFADCDGLTIEETKEKKLSEYELSEDHFFAVQYEIESWYYAGVSEKWCLKSKLKHFQSDTNFLTKEQFISKLNKASDKLYIMAQMLSVYDSSLACDRNNSFRYFWKNKREPAAV